MVTLSGELEVCPELQAQARRAGWGNRFKGILRRVRRPGPLSKEQATLISGAAGSTRQQRRARAFEETFAEVCRIYGGGRNWARGDCEPRRARRRIARAWAKKRWQEGTDG